MSFRNRVYLVAAVAVVASASLTAPAFAAAPSAPANVVASRGDGLLAATWDAAVANGSIVSGYTVTATPGGLTCNATSAIRTCAIAGLSNGTQYSVRVVAHSDQGDSLPSAASNAVVPAGLPAAPAAPAAQAGDGQVTLTWSSAFANGEAITSYTASSAPSGRSCTTSGLSCTISNLSNGTAYTFRVVATNAIGDSTASPATSSIVPMGNPSVPLNVSASARDGAAVVSWQAPANGGGGAIVSYTAVSSPDGRTCQTSALTCTISGLANGTSYSFSVRASNLLASSPSSQSSNEVIPAGTPFAPTQVVALAGDSSAAVSWTEANGNGLAVSSYRATATPDGLSCTTVALSCTINGLRNGVDYTFQVKAFNALGESALSVRSNSVRPRLEIIPTLTLTGIQDHHFASDCYSAIEGTVYNLSDTAWFSTLSPGDRSKAVPGLCGRVGTLYWTQNYVRLSPEFSLADGLVAYFDTASITKKIRRAELYYGPYLCLVTYGNSIFDLGSRYFRESAGDQAAIKAGCNTLVSTARLVEILSVLGMQASDLVPYKVGQYLAPRDIRFVEVKRHNSQAACWTSFDKKVYDLTDWIREVGASSRLTAEVCGKLSPSVWNSQQKLSLRRYILGPLVPGPALQPQVLVRKSEVQLHATASNCWTIVNGNIFAITPWLNVQSDGKSLARSFCGVTGTSLFSRLFAGANATSYWAAYRIGTLDNSPEPAVRTYAKGVVALHGSTNNCWSIIYGGVYNLTAYFATIGAASASVIAKSACGGWGNVAFKTYIRGSISEKLGKYQIGYLIGFAP